MGRKLTAEQEMQIVSEYEAGASLSQLGRKHGVVLQTIRHVLKRNAVNRRPRGAMVQRISEEEATGIAERWRTGESIASIALSLGTSHQRVSRVLAFYGLAPETRFRSGEQHPAWKGGRTLHAEGYVLVRVEPDSPFEAMRNTEGYVMEHRLVMATSLGRPLRPTETVHHINGEHADNRLENLQLRIKKHGKHEAWVCLDCGSHNIGAVAIEGVAPSSP